MSVFYGRLFLQFPTVPHRRALVSSSLNEPYLRWSLFSDLTEIPRGSGTGFVWDDEGAPIVPLIPSLKKRSTLDARQHSFFPFGVDFYSGTGQHFYAVSLQIPFFGIWISIWIVFFLRGSGGGLSKSTGSLFTPRIATTAYFTKAGFDGGVR